MSNKHLHVFETDVYVRPGPHNLTTETAPEAATDATAGAVDAIAKAASEAADAVAAVPAKIEEALSPQATEEEGVEVQAISPANSLTASIVGLAAVAAALAFQFVL